MTTTAVRSGFRAGMIELRQNFTGTALIGQVFWPVATLVVMWFLRDVTVTGARLGPLVLPSTIGMFVAFGMLLTVQQLAADREDGTLLRARATPHGIRGHLVGKFVNVSAIVLAYLVILLVLGTLLIGGLSITGSGWLTLAWVLALGLIATQSLGAVFGALVRSSRGAGMMSVPVIGLITISGIFYPITALPAGSRTPDRSSRSTGSASACAPLSYPPTRRWRNSATPGGTLRQPPSSVPGGSRV